MAITPRGIWTPDSGEEYDLTVDAATTASTIDAALQKAANYGVGTTAEMNAALGDFPNGAMWFNTTNSTEYRRVAGAWVAVPPSVIENVASGGAVFSASGGATTNSVQGYRIGNLVTIQAALQNVSAPAGNQSTTLGTIASGWRPTGWTAFSVAGSNRGASGLVSSSGTVTLRWLDTSLSNSNIYFSMTHYSPL